eukprot:scaffold736_cov254-Pinguiococcus_pyrenoidosus.AAC.39
MRRTRHPEDIDAAPSPKAHRANGASHPRRGNSVALCTPSQVHPFFATPGNFMRRRLPLRLGIGVNPDENRTTYLARWIGVARPTLPPPTLFCSCHWVSAGYLISLVPPGDLSVPETAFVSSSPPRPAPGPAREASPSTASRSAKLGFAPSATCRASALKQAVYCAPAQYTAGPDLRSTDFPAVEHRPDRPLFVEDTPQQRARHGRSSEQALCESPDRRRLRSKGAEKAARSRPRRWQLSPRQETARQVELGPPAGGTSRWVKSALLTIFSRVSKARTPHGVVWNPFGHHDQDSPRCSPVDETLQRSWRPEVASDPDSVSSADSASSAAMATLPSLRRTSSRSTPILIHRPPPSASAADLRLQVFQRLEERAASARRAKAATFRRNSSEDTEAQRPDEELFGACILYGCANCGDPFPNKPEGPCFASSRGRSLGGGIPTRFCSGECLISFETRMTSLGNGQP